MGQPSGNFRELRARPAKPYDPDNPLYTLTDEQLEELGKEFDALHDEIFNDLGETDARYIRNMITLQRRLVAMSRPKRDTGERRRERTFRCPHKTLCQASACGKVC